MKYLCCGMQTSKDGASGTLAGQVITAPDGHETKSLKGTQIQ